MEAKFSEIFELLFVRQTTAEIRLQGFPRDHYLAENRRPSFLTRADQFGRHAKRPDPAVPDRPATFFDSQRVEPLIGDIIEFHERRSGDVSEMLGLARAYALDSCPIERKGP
jgi:hypothetical protein